MTTETVDQLRQRLPYRDCAGVALFMTTVASLCGSMVGVVILAVFAPTVAEFALTFGSVEYFALIVLGMTGAAVL